MALSRQHLKVNDIRCPNYPKSRPSAAACSPSWRGQRSCRAEVRRKDLRFPFQKDFIARLEGQTVTGLGRRAKYLLADLASGDVLLMHLGMSGSFRVVKDEGREGAGHSSIIRALRISAHDHVVFHMSSGAAVDFQRSAPVRLHEDHRPPASWKRSRC